MRRVLVALFLVSGTLVSCRTFDVQSQRVFLRHEPRDDSLDLVLVYDGVGATNEDAERVKETADVLASMRSGRPHFLFWDWPFDIDLQEIAAKCDPTSSIDSLIASLARKIELREQRFLLDSGRLCLVQRLHIVEAASFLRSVDQLINAFVLEELSHEPPPSRRRPAGIETSRDLHNTELVRARALTGGSWVELAGSTLEVSVPMSPEQAACELRGILSDVEDVRGDLPWLSLLVASLTGLSITGGELRLSFAPASDGWIAWTLEDDEREYSPDVAKKLNSAEAIPTEDLETAIRRAKEARSD